MANGRKAGKGLLIHLPYSIVKNGERAYSDKETDARVKGIGMLSIYLGLVENAFNDQDKYGT